ncbi:MAG TPA: ATP-binding protein [Pyrinomonadaceae bacterium]|jgi:serine/threonine-protein kinase RsbW
MAMPPITPFDEPGERRILGRVAPEEFVGRSSELANILRHAARGEKGRGLLLLLAPSAGVSELLRQAYDELFRQQGAALPIHFALTRAEKTASGIARHFLHNFLQQYIAFRRNEPSLCHATLTHKDWLELSPPADYEWIERLIENYEHERTRGDERALVRFCLSAPQRAAARGVLVFQMLDTVQMAEHLNGTLALGAEFVQALRQSPSSYVFSGLRRMVLNIVQRVPGGIEDADVVRLDRLTDEDARALAEHVARRREVTINEQTRDLIVQQFDGSPFFITALIRAAHDQHRPLDSFRHCQQLYVDELMGGAIHRHCASILEQIAPQTVTRRALVRLLHESASSDKGKILLENWRKKLNLEAEQFQHLTQALHVHELASLDANFVEVNNESLVWKDYLRTRYRLDVAGDSRALVVADTLIETMKRAPQTMARHYRRAAALGLRELMSGFNCQRVPASLLHYDRFSQSYKGVELQETVAGLDAETELVRLPQIVHVASGAAFHPSMQAACDEERCAIAHGFDAGSYTETNEVVWMAAEIESKLEAGRGLTEIWCDRLMGLARVCGFQRVRLWLVSREGFSSEASELLTERGAYSSSRRQLELLAARLSQDSSSAKTEIASDEFEMVIPMGDDTELIAAHTVEQIARRIDFQPEAINQIKTALVEACINASEHSLSPDRKIYQRFRVESDRLVVTVSSRGVVPPGLSSPNSDNGIPQENGNGALDATKERRGWGLKLIKSLMDEVEFERVDDGTRLRMTKYLRKS